MLWLCSTHSYPVPSRQTGSGAAIVGQLPLPPAHPRALLLFLQPNPRGLAPRNEIPVTDPHIVTSSPVLGRAARAADF
ncbi:hypothetical protein Pcinc_007578 [Petrolisthes cinctipes]|uniref:Uncharacterized protein n=1 Tax=Petrolisthes cinctipes TaxID=88211 RepID=A0AAE1G916_PETCI|nr:hypothetical protein Pcinc_007578 [Petrolisthes cinctipes]